MEKGIIGVETRTVSGIDNFAPGYIDKENEVIVGLQTDAPLKRIVNLYGGIRTAEQALEQYGCRLDPIIEKHFRLYRKTHNDGVFDAYPERTRLARSAGLLTGLPDAYGRGRIIGDYRRVPLYGTDFLKNMAVISRAPPKQPVKPYKTFIWPTSPESRKTTAPPRAWAAPLRFSIFISSAIWIWEF